MTAVGLGRLLRLAQSVDVMLEPLDAQERESIHAIEHSEHLSEHQVSQYLQWSRLRGCALDAPYEIVAERFPSASVEVRGKP